MGGIVDKKEVIKDILKKLNQGMSFEDAKKEVVTKIGAIESSELFAIEQELINEGISPDEIKRFCNVHALLFEGMFENRFKDPSSPIHPINLFKAENQKIKEKINQLNKYSVNKDFASIKKILDELRLIDVHYQRKEQIIFPYLERQGFFGPSKVMWAKDDEVRSLLKKAIENFKENEDYIKNYLNPLINEIDSMIFKEENVFIPTCIEKLSQDDWINIFKQSANLGYVFIETPKENFEVEDLELRSRKSNFKDGYIEFPSGRIRLEDLRCLLDTLPFDITFVDKDGRVAYYSNSKERIFLRTPAVIGREVKNCHPPKSIDAVEKVIDDLKNKRVKSHDFWLNFKGRLIYIRYFAVRNEFDEFLGILEVTQDITDIKKIDGEKRLVWKK